MPTGDPICPSCGNYTNLCDCIRTSISSFPYGYMPQNTFTPYPTLESQDLKNRIIELENQLLEMKKRIEFLEKSIQSKSSKKNFTGKKK